MLFKAAICTGRAFHQLSNRIAAKGLVALTLPLRSRTRSLTMSTRRSARLSAGAHTNGSPPTSAMPPPPGPVARPRKRKAEEKPRADAETAPSTPQKRRVTKAAPPPPATPTPSAIGLMAAPTKRTPRKNSAVTRVADPEGTNAPLLSPETSRVLAPKPIADISASQQAAVPATTDDILDKACAHLASVDARMAPLIKAHRCHMFTPEGLAEKIDPFEALVSGILSQQVSGAAAKSIKKRFVELFPDNVVAAGDEAKPRFPTPSQVVTKPLETLRTAGLSQRKAEYVSGLAEKFVSGELSAELLANAPYEEVLERLVAVRGLGRWSVEMFACFALKRLDVFSTGDLGVQRGMAAFVGRDIARLKAKGGKWKYMTESEMEELAERFRPYRTLFMWYMWRVEDTDVSTMET
jgi:DNA-3-methyladenine glycosylase II